jgi:hypothetical protein
MIGEDQNLAISSLPPERNIGLHGTVTSDRYVRNKKDTKESLTEICLATNDGVTLPTFILSVIPGHGSCLGRLGPIRFLMSCQVGVCALRHKNASERNFITRRLAVEC